jgi:hypothetical protein
VSFDERLVNYGHEDTLFGFQLKKNEIQISHISNPVLNGDIEDNDVFLTKTELGLYNLGYILHYINSDPEYIEDVRILECYQKYCNIQIIRVIEAIFLIFKPFMKALLSKGVANMVLLDFYKLGFFAVKYRAMKK